MGMIPEEAVEAAAEWLPHSGDCEVRPERDCTCWKARVDFMRAALEAAAPHMLAGAWLEGRNSQPDKFTPNPYWSADVTPDFMTSEADAITKAEALDEAADEMARDQIMQLNTSKQGDDNE